MNQDVMLLGGNLPNQPSKRPIATECATREGGLEATFLKDAEIGFAEMNNVSIIIT